jgi:hypothetical protein
VFAASVEIWRHALGFQLRHFPRLVPILPLLVLPVLGDALQSVLIAQERSGGAIDVQRAVREALRVTPRLAAMKLAFEGAALAWAFVPIYGIIQGMRHRLYWAMASNVIVFEQLSGEAGRARCRLLAEADGLPLALWTLVKLPAMLALFLLVLWLGVATALDQGYSTGLFLWLAASFWVASPGSAAANTFLYLEIVPRAAGDAVRAELPPSAIRA